MTVGEAVKHPEPKWTWLGIPALVLLVAAPANAAESTVRVSRNNLVGPGVELAFTSATVSHHFAVQGRSWLYLRDLDQPTKVSCVAHWSGDATVGEFFTWRGRAYSTGLSYTLSDPSKKIEFIVAPDRPGDYAYNFSSMRLAYCDVTPV